MPTVLVIDGYRVFFYSNENNEPPHVHVEKGEAIGKWWLRPVRCEWKRGFKRGESKKADIIVKENQRRLLEAWDDYFGN